MLRGLAAALAAERERSTPHRSRSASRRRFRYGCSAGVRRGTIPTALLSRGEATRVRVHGHLAERQSEPRHRVPRPRRCLNCAICDVLRHPTRWHKDPCQTKARRRVRAAGSLPAQPCHCRKGISRVLRRLLLLDRNSPATPLFAAAPPCGVLNRNCPALRSFDVGADAV
jgi:hypothetical protein